MQQHSGPLPPPALLEHYNSVIPNGAERIMAMAEREQSHRHEMNRRDQSFADRAEDHEFTLAQRGQVFGITISVAVLVTAVVLALKGHAAVAAVIAGLDLVALAAVFVAGRYLPKRSSSDEAAARSVDESTELSTIGPDE